jgi:hypothetical protein
MGARFAISPSQIPNLSTDEPPNEEVTSKAASSLLDTAALRRDLD